MKWHSKIFRGEVTHERLSPRRHAFTYPVTFFAFDIAELDALGAALPGFGHNQRQILSLRDSDYLYGHSRPIDRQLDALLPGRQPGDRIRLITSPRYLGYAFNPVNFHLRTRGGQLAGVVAEVNNTFGDRHVYPLPDLQPEGADCWTASCPKDFHVSPFNDMSGFYRFTFRVQEDELFLGVDLYRGNACVMKTWIQGKGAPLERSSLIRHVLLHPLDTAFNSMPRILWQAARLHYQRKLQVYRRPSPDSPRTLIDRDRASDPGTVV